MVSVMKAVTAGCVAAALLSSSVASAAPAPPPVAQPSAWAALSGMSGIAPAVALCGAAVTTGAQPATGCVLPQTDATLAPAPLAGPPPPPPAFSAMGTMWPLLFMLAAVAALDLYLLLNDHHRHAVLVPNSPG